MNAIKRSDVLATGALEVQPGGEVTKSARSAAEAGDVQSMDLEVDFGKLPDVARDKIDVMIISTEVQNVALSRVKTEEAGEANKLYWKVRGLVLHEMELARRGVGKEGYKVSLFALSNQIRQALLVEIFGTGEEEQLNSYLRTIPTDINSLPLQREQGRRRRMMNRLASVINAVWQDITEELKKAI